MGILFTIPMGFLFTITMGILFTITIGIQLTIYTIKIKKAFLFHLKLYKLEQIEDLRL